MKYQTDLASFSQVNSIVQGFTMAGASTDPNYKPPPRVDEGPKQERDPRYPEMIKKAVPVDVPKQFEPKGKRLPHYVTPERLEREGYTPDMIKTLNPKSTPIAYHEAEKRNAEERARHEERPENKGKDYIPTYHPDKRIVKGESDPEGGAKLARFHPDEDDPAGRFHASPQEIQEKLERQMNAGRQNADVKVKVKEALALPTDPNYVSEAELQPGRYNVELSFAVSGGQQANIEPVKVIDSETRIEQIKYSNTTPTKEAYAFLFGREPR